MPLRTPPRWEATGFPRHERCAGGVGPRCGQWSHRSAAILEAEQLRARAEEGSGGDRSVPSTIPERDEVHGRDPRSVSSTPSCGDRTSNLLERTSESTNVEVIPHFFTEEAALSFAVLLAVANKWRGVRMDVFAARKVEELRNELLPQGTSEESAA